MNKVYFILSVAFLSLGCLMLNPTAEPTTEPTLEPASEPTVTTDPTQPIEPIATTDPTQPIEVQAGETFDIVLDANPSTGYHWEFIGELDGNIVEFVSRDYIADEPVKPGSGGVDVWTFKAVSAGQAQIILGSYPPDPDATEPWQTLTFNIAVK